MTIRIFDIVMVCLVIALVVLFVGVLARQRFMLRADGAIPIAVRNGHRWSYGVARYAGEEFRVYMALGLGTRPSRRLARGSVVVDRRQPPGPNERVSLPESAVVVECHDATGSVTLGLSDSAYTGFVSWLESSAPRS